MDDELLEDEFIKEIGKVLESRSLTYHRRYNIEKGGFMTNAKIKAPRIGVLKLDLSQCTNKELKEFIAKSKVKKSTEKTKE